MTAVRRDEMMAVAGIAVEAVVDQAAIVEVDAAVRQNQVEMSCLIVSDSLERNI